MTLLATIAALVPFQGPGISDSLPALFNNTSAASLDHSRLAVGTIAEGVRVIDLAKKQVDLSIPPFESPVVSLAWSPNGAKLALHSRNGTLQIVDSRTGALLCRIDTCQGRVAFAAGGAVVLVALGSQPATLWPVTGGARIAALSLHEGRPATAMAVSRDGELVALGDDASGIAVWKARTGERVHEVLDVPRGRDCSAINALDFDLTGKMLAVGGGDCTVRLYEIGSRNPPRELSHCDTDAFHDEEIGAVRFSPDGTRLVSTTLRWWEARVWDVASGKMVDQLEGWGGLSGPMNAWFSSDGKLVTLAMDCQTIEIGKGRIRPEPYVRRHIWYRSDGDIAWAEFDGRLHICRLSDGEVIASFSARKP